LDHFDDKDDDYHGFLLFTAKSGTATVADPEKDKGMHPPVPPSHRFAKPVIQPYGYYTLINVVFCSDCGG